MTYIERKGKTPEYLADKFVEQLTRVGLTIIVIDDVHNCINVAGTFADERVKIFFTKFIQEVRTLKNIKMILSSNRHIFQIEDLEIGKLEISKLENSAVESIISYC